ncbi:cryptochrome/photolyase family protein [Pontibaca salina]|uniref:Deoxyribodipyrimidine photo-lyase n=1 Tax=Pontibaca salina TaxID=2795731 RepID=A0A934HP54_9RHOB|nr:deoxyribodipyrimidine photo-lyase [Pontibaca salina]MBI6629177.1 deoxyribodipyrimidine photo-lyase [Pontibaca salina]
MNGRKTPVILWFRRDLRLSDHPALRAACALGGPIIPVFVLDDTFKTLGAAPKWRLGLGLEHFAQVLAKKGSRLILRRGAALDVLRSLIDETGADAIYWSRLYDPGSVARDSAVKAALKQQGIAARSFGGHLLFEPGSVQTQSGTHYKVYTPFWNAVKTCDVEQPLAAPEAVPAPDKWPDSDDLADWQMGAGMDRGAAIMRPHVQLGEAAALARLDYFLSDIVAGYGESRNYPAQDGTSQLSENLALGEISPHRCWHAAARARHEGAQGAQIWQKELVWREFAYHLMHHTPRLLSENWKADWDTFPWNTDKRLAPVKAWQQGRTGMAFVDAAMREMYVTGRMHNRGRMIAASYLTKHLLCHWKIGLDWFADCLIDWDPANNALGWQWSAGTGPDATPYFRVFNPETQRVKFDPERVYVKTWIAEEQADPPQTALDYYRAIPRHWPMHPQDTYPEPIVGAKDGRGAALRAYEDRDF